MNKTLAACLVISGAVLIAQAQGTFQNLDFEAAHSLSPPSSAFATSNALPGWSAFAGTNPLTSIAYNWAASVPSVGLYGSNSFVISGSFTTLLYNGGSISQTGLVPADTESLRFKGSWSSLTPLSVSLGGQSLSITALSSNSNYTLYGADVSAFAGQTANLAFLAGSPSIYLLDDIEFSPQIIPEPTLVSLLSLGSLLLAANRFIRQRRV